MAGEDLPTILLIRHCNHPGLAVSWSPASRAGLLHQHSLSTCARWLLCSVCAITPAVQWCHLAGSNCPGNTHWPRAILSPQCWAAPVCSLTIHSSRSRFAARLNSGVRRHMSAPSEFEKRVLDACLAGDDPALQTLRRQADACEVTQRNHTGVGAYVDFSVPDSVPRLDSRVIIIGDVNLEVRNVPHGVATLLYIYEGRLQFIEFATYEGDWPKDPEIIGIGYFHEVQISDSAFNLAPVSQRHPETLARSLRGREPQGAA